jgi:SWI/SNF-related matrix-associated actin-dependent regulator of chromatin subfamily A-like protein 1
LLPLSWSDGAFRLGRTLDPFLLGELEARGLPAPRWEPAVRAWSYPEGSGIADALLFLADAGLLQPDDEAAGRLEALRSGGLVPSRRQRLAELETRLRSYQREGVDAILARRRVLLADAMGLGKSLQALVAVEKAGAYPCVVVCPGAVKIGWRREALKWVPWRLTQVLQAGRDRVRGADITVLNPELLGRHLEDLKALPPRSVVLDEAHFFKNPSAQRSRHAMELADGVPLRIALTGTPIKNRRSDLVHQLRLLGQLEATIGIYRGLLPHWWKPGRDPIAEAHAVRVVEALDGRTLGERLREVCMVRRTKEEVARELPPIVRTRIDVTLAQPKGYQQREQAMLAWVRKWQERFGAEAAAMEPAASMEFRAHLSALRREAALAKVPHAAEWAEELVESGERVVFFAYHKEVVHRLAAALPGRAAVVTGDMPAPARRATLDALGSYDFLCATMDSTGHGVDGIQLHASQVAFVELDWTPTKHEQCEGRLHRIGQADPVNSWYFVAANTIDRAMMGVLEAKWSDIQGIVDLREGQEQAFLETLLRAVLSGLDGSAGSRIPS